jgi:hypothetical protein
MPSNGTPSGTSSKTWMHGCRTYSERPAVRREPWEAAITSSRSAWTRFRVTRSTLAPEAKADEARSCNLRLRGFESLLVLHSPEELGWSSTRLVSGRSPVRTRPWAPKSTSSYPDMKLAFLVMCRDAALVRRKAGLDSRRRLQRGRGGTGIRAFRRTRHDAQPAGSSLVMAHCATTRDPATLRPHQPRSSMSSTPKSTTHKPSSPWTATSCRWLRCPAGRP